MKIIYRIQTSQGEGLWYKPDGTYGGRVCLVSEARCKDLPMDQDLTLAAEKWRSGTETLEEMRQWISSSEVQGLAIVGLFLWEVEVSDHGWRRTEHPYQHAVYLDKHVISRTQIPWKTLYQ